MKKLILILFALVIAQEITAQQDPQYTQYMYNMNIINPAYAGISEGLSIGALYRSQWVGLDGGPETFTFNIHSPVGKQLALGLSVISDKIGPVEETNAYVDVSFRISPSFMAVIPKDELVEINFESSNLEKALNYISIFTLFGALLITYTYKKRFLNVK